jgi:hypothetical protein
MDGIKVKEVSAEPEKSKQQIEAELLEKHEAQFEDSDSQQEEQKIEIQDTAETTEAVEEQQEEQTQNELGDNEVLSYIKNRYDREINSLDDLFEQRESNDDLPEDVSTFLKFKQDTGRGLEDFIKLNRNLDDIDQDQLLADYWSETKPHLDADDVAFELDNRFGYDDDLDDESEVRKIKIAKKEELVKAKDYFQKQKEQYNVPLESSGSFATDEERNNFEAYKKQKAQESDVLEQNRKRQEFFLEKTNEVFSDDFKGFDFKVGEKELVYKPGTPDQLKKTQSDVNNFIGMHVGEDGYIKDAAKYHKSLAVAMNPEAFAKFFYEQGMADAIGDVTRESKNVDMPVRRSPESVTKGGFKVTSLGDNRGSGLRIRSKK